MPENRGYNGGVNGEGIVCRDLSMRTAVLCDRRMTRRAVFGTGNCSVQDPSTDARDDKNLIPVTLSGAARLC